jgi:hypothetical protein
MRPSRCSARLDTSPTRRNSNQNWCANYRLTRATVLRTQTLNKKLVHDDCCFLRISAKTQFLGVLKCGSHQQRRPVNPFTSVGLPFRSSFTRITTAPSTWAVAAIWG